MRLVVGRATRELDAAGFAELRARHPGGVLVDLGTGDGRHVLAVARERPDMLVLGVDAAPDAMRRAAAGAARRPVKGGVPNALFVWAAAEALPAELTDLAGVHVLMPWGSLLRAFAAPDAGLLGAVAARCRTGAEFLVTLNLHAWRPAVPEVGDLPEPGPAVADAYAAAGWAVTDARYLDDAGVAALATSWTKRLGSSREELAVLALRGVIAPRVVT